MPTSVSPRPSVKPSVPASAPPRSPAAGKPPHKQRGEQRIRVRCLCGASGFVAESLAGRHLQCKVCGATVVVPAKGEPQAPPPDVKAVEVAVPSLARAPSVKWRGSDGRWHDEEAEANAGPARSWMGDAVRSVVLVRKPGDLATLAALWAAATAVAMGLCMVRASANAYAGVPDSMRMAQGVFYALGVLGALALVILLCAVVESTALHDGDRVLPSLASIKEELRKWQGERLWAVWASLVAMAAPAAAARLLLPADGLLIWTRDEIVFAMLALCAALGPTLALMGALADSSIILNPMNSVRTASAYIPAYFVCAAAAMGPFLLCLFAVNPVYKAMGGQTFAAMDELSFALLAPSAALAGAGVLLLLVAMRLTGLYYRHFEERFPWEAV